jgi:hypothetical protein
MDSFTSRIDGDSNRSNAPEDVEARNPPSMRRLLRTAFRLKWSVYSTLRPLASLAAPADGLGGPAFAESALHEAAQNASRERLRIQRFMVNPADPCPTAIPDVAGWSK